MAPGQARSHVRQVLLSAEVHRQTVFVAGLLTQELVANAVKHTESDPIHVAVTVTAEVTVNVWDDDPRPVSLPPAPSPDGEHGRGLLMVEALSTGWGCLLEGAGKSIWFRLPTVLVNDSRRPLSD